MKVYQICAARIGDMMFKDFEIEAKTKGQAEKKFKKLFGAYWILWSIKQKTR